MNNSTKKAIAVILNILILAVAYYGSYLPLQKSKSHIETIRNLSGASNLDDFKKRLSATLDLPSPIGQEELVKQTGSVILKIINQSQIDPLIVKNLVEYINSYYEPIINRGRGMSYGQDLFILGSINETAFFKTSEQPYFDAAKKYFSLALEAGPKRPQSLFSMFDIFRIEGNAEGAQAIAAQILSQWPDDQRTRDTLNEFLNQILTKKK